MPDLTIGPDSAFAILLKAREFDEKVDQTDPDSGSNPTDDVRVDALEFGAHDPTRHELFSAISDLNDDEQFRSDRPDPRRSRRLYPERWDGARSAAGEVGRARTPRFFMEFPLVSDFPGEALSRINLSIQYYLDSHRRRDLRRFRPVCGRPISCIVNGARSRAEDP